MKRANHFLTAAFSLAFTCCLSVHAQPFTATDAPAQNWVALASCADGTKLVAAGSYGSLYLSTNSGATWTPAFTTTGAQEPQRPWTAVSSSADGQTLVAAADFQPIFLSTNGGVSWRQTGPSGNWAATAISADGARILAADAHGGVYLSKNSGDTWAATAAPIRRWRSLACSADSTKIFLGSDSGTNYSESPAIYCSYDLGASWVQTSAPGQPWQSLACSADGTRAVAGAYGGLVYLTADSGTTWTQAALPSRRWGGVACSSDGARTIAAAWEGDVYLSGDSGRNWNKAQAPSVTWLPVACSADGIHFFAGVWDASTGGIYEANLPPLLNISPSESSTVISWAGPATGYVLQKNSDITSANWSAVTVSPTTAAGQNQVVFKAAPGACAYRLVKAASLLQVTADAARSGPLKAQRVAPGGS